MAWETKRIKDFASLITEKTKIENKVALENIEEATGKYIETDTEFDGDGIHFFKGDILYGKLRPYLRKVFLSNMEGNAVGDIFVFRNKNNSIPEYLKWLFLSEDFTSKCNGSTQGAKMPRVDSIFILTLSYNLPPLETQQKIADYLDVKTQNIDKRIELLQKKKEHYIILRKAIISEIVNENKSEWKNVRLKDCLREPLKYGANASGIEYDNSLPRYIRITDIDEAGNLHDDDLLSLSYENAEDYLLKNGDILLARSGATVGKSFLYEDKFGIAAYAGYLIKASLKKNYSPKYLYYYTQSIEYDNWTNRNVIQATIQNLSADKYNYLMIKMPTLEEQVKLVNFLDKKTSAIDSIIEKITTEIDTLKTYRRALINEAVTGKLNIE